MRLAKTFAPSIHRILMFSGALVLPFTAFPSSIDAKASQLTIARELDADGLDPQKTGTTQSQQVTNLIFDTLLTMDINGSLHPGVATKWNISEDGKTYTFTIRPDVFCHDGSILDASAVKFNLDRAVDPSTINPAAAAWGPIKKTEALGDKVIVTLSEPYVPFASGLATMRAGLICPSSFTGAEYRPVGSGPFRFVSWTRNDRIVLASNPDYKNTNPLVENPGKPYIDTLTIKVIAEPFARMAALRTGEVDMAEPSLEEAADLDADPQFAIHTAQLSGQVVFAAFTPKLKPFDNLEVRKAIATAMNRDAYANIAFEGLSRTTDCPIAPHLVGNDESKCGNWITKYDPAEARALLSKAGFSAEHPLKLKLLVLKQQGWDRMHEIMVHDLAQIGVKAELESRDPAGFFAYMDDVNQKMEGEPAVWTTGMDGVDPDYLYFLWRRPGFVNMGLNSQLDELLDEQRRLTGERRLAKLREIQKYLLEHVYMVPILSPGWGWLMASNNKVQGFKTGFMVGLIFNDVKVAE